MREKKEKDYATWPEIFEALRKQAAVDFLSHNARYMTKKESIAAQEAGQTPTADRFYPANYPARIKCAEQTTLYNLLRQFAQQIAHQVNISRRQAVCNVVETNRVKARGKYGARVANRHIAKGVLCGVIAGEIITGPAADDQPAEYRFGPGLAAIPFKRWHGSSADFELLIGPSLSLTGCLPERVQYVTADDFPSAPDAPAPLPMRRKTPPLEGRQETSNKNIIEVAPAEAAGIQNDFEAGNSENVEKPGAEVKRNAENFSGASAIDRHELAANQQATAGDGKKTSSGSAGAGQRSSFVALALAGQLIEAYVTLLLESYLKKLATAMERSYHPGELDNARQAIRQMLAACDPAALDGFVDRCLRTIDHMQQWLLYHRALGQPRGLANPSNWFSLTYDQNIKGAYLKYLVPWEENAAAWRQMATETGSGKDQKKEDVQIRRESGFHNLAYLLKYRLLPWHPSDRRLQAADLTKWADDMRKLHKIDRTAPDQIEKVLTWLVSSPSAQAKFWRKEAGGAGLKSASGFRRNFAAMQNQMIQEQVKAQKYTETPKR